MEGILPNFRKFKVVEGTALGRGIVAIDDFVEDEIVCKIAGPIMSLMDFFEKYERDGCNVLQIDRERFIDVIEPYVLFNHSCDPNCGIRNNGIIFTLKEIKKGDELRFDYSTTADDIIWSMKCECGSKICRKIIGDFQTLPHERKIFYFGKNALTKYIKNMYY